MITLVKLVELVKNLPSCSKLKGKHFTHFMKNKSVKSMFFSPVTPQNIIDVVTNLKGNKSSGHDEIH